MRTSVYRILALTVALAMLLGVLPLTAAAKPGPDPIPKTPSGPEIVLFNSDLERGDESWWELTGVKSNAVKRLLYDTHNSSYYLNLRPADPDEPEMHASYTVELEPGTYCFTFDLCGQDTGDSRSGLSWSVRAGETVLAAQTLTMFTYGRDSWHSYQTDSFTLSEPTEITFDFGGTPYLSSYWAKVDNLRLYGDGGLAFEPYLDWITLEDGDFESGTGCWSLTGLDGEIIHNSSSSWNDSRVLNLWVSNSELGDIALSYTVTLTQGYYDFSFQMDGADGDSGLSWSVTAGGQTLCQGGTLVTTGWDEWQDYTTDQFVLRTTTEVTFTLSGTLPAGYWAHLDEVRLDGTGVIFHRLNEIILPNGDFELGDGSYWELDGYDDSYVVENTGSNVNDSYVLSLWKSNTQTMFVRAAYYLTLTPGTYQFTFDFEGQDICSTLQAIVHEVGGSCHYETDYLETTGWDEWTTYESNVFEIFETTRLYFEIVGELQAGYWGHLDNLRLYGTGSIYGGLPPMQTDDGNFDYGGSYWSISGFSSPDWNYDSEVNSSYCLPLGISEEENVEASASYLMRLLPGSYELSFDMEGDAGRSGLQAIVSSLGSELPDGDAVLRNGETILYESGELETSGFDQWETHRTDAFTLTQPGWVKFELCGTVPAGYSGHFDNLKLWGDGDFYPDWFDHDPTLTVPQVQGVDEYEFVRGADVSSYYSLIQAGAQFYDYEGNLLDEEGFFNLLSRAGFNYVRIRVWVDPYDALGNGYGGGNNDLVTARYLARLATDAGLRVMIDFHYSDFWADPGKQQAPKAWASYSLQQKADAIEEYTYNSLKSIKQHAYGCYVDMVQIGNETTTGFCGETDWADMAALFAAGARAVRRLDEERMEETKVTLHFTDPEQTAAIKGFADTLDQYSVDYDVFATSWYPYRHGSAENLTDVLSYVADTYDKEVLVAETSWAWTLEDGDGWANTVSPTANSTDMPYAFSQQGQADELVAAAQAVRNVGQKGLGVFCWENAWIPVQYAYDANGNLDQAVLASNQNAWESYGCGWASSYAGEYQADAATGYGGSAVDNQAMFDFHGRALDSLWTWYYMMFGTEELFGTEKEPIETSDLHIYSSISVGTDMVVTYTARKSDLTDYEKFWIKVVKHNPEGDVSYRYGEDQAESLSDLNPDGSTASTWKARFTHIFAKEMGIDVSARLYARDAAGQIWMSPVLFADMRDYLGGRLVADNNSVEQRVLAADMLNYGAAAQMFTGFQTDHLVNQELTRAQYARYRQYVTTDLAPVNKTNYNTRPEGQPNILFTSVTLGNEVLLNLTIRLAEGTEGVQVLVKDHATGAVVTTLDTTFHGSTFNAVFNGIGADAMRTEYDLVTLVNGVETGNIRTWSVEAYVGEIRAEGIPLKVAMANALLTYGDSAAAYFAAQ